jgi:hypothetical protein
VLDSFWTVSQKGCSRKFGCSILCHPAPMRAENSLSVQVHLDAEEGEGHAVGGDAALL